MAKLYCYSATGNSLYAAQKIAAALDAEICPMTAAGAVCDAEIVGFVFPVFFWGLPKTVEAFFSAVSLTAKNPYVFSVATYGSMPGGASGAAAAALRRRNITLNYSGAVRCVENYLPAFAVNDHARTWAYADRALATVIADVSAQKAARARPYGPVSHLVHRFYPARKADCDRHFSVHSCTGCGLCAQLCPAGNIRMENGKPVFSGHCDLCLACLHGCSAGAIEWGNHTAGKARYHNPRVNTARLRALHSDQESQP